MTPVEFGNPMVPPSVRRHLSQTRAPVVTGDSWCTQVRVGAGSIPAVQRHIGKVNIGGGAGLLPAVQRHVAPPVLKVAVGHPFVPPSVERHVSRAGQPVALSEGGSTPAVEVALGHPTHPPSVQRHIATAPTPKRVYMGTHVNPAVLKHVAKHC